MFDSVTLSQMDLECGGGGLQQAAPAAPAAASESAYAIHQQLTQLKKATEECKLEMEATRQKQEQHSLTFYKHHQVTGVYITQVQVEFDVELTKNK